MKNCDKKARELHAEGAKYALQVSPPISLLLAWYTIYIVARPSSYALHKLVDPMKVLTTFTLASTVSSYWLIDWHSMGSLMDRELSSGDTASTTAAKAAATAATTARATARAARRKSSVWWTYQVIAINFAYI